MAVSVLSHRVGRVAFRVQTVFAASTLDWSGLYIPDQFRTVNTRVWNVAHDGTLRQAFSLNNGGHTPRLAYKNGRVALTFIRLHWQYDWLDSRRLLFLECPQ